jgi:hypothetical protein
LRVAGELGYTKDAAKPQVARASGAEEPADWTAAVPVVTD